MEKTFSGGSQLLTTIGVPADDFHPYKKIHASLARVYR
jgi:hypothetical protein